MLTTDDDIRDCAASHAEAIAAMRERLTVVGNHRVFGGDCLDIMAALAYGRPVDSIVTDPPYELNFMSRSWDRSGITFQPEVWRACFDLLKPGGHLIAFCGDRNYHRMVVAIEDAGFEIRRMGGWLYGSGFPKSMDVSKAIDTAAGAQREVVGQSPNSRSANNRSGNAPGGFSMSALSITAPATAEARQWTGWGTDLKPALEPFVIARKPLSEPTIAANVLKHGTGGLNIDACRIPVQPGDDGGHWGGLGANSKIPYSGFNNHATYRTQKNPQGRFPANLMHDGSAPVADIFPAEESRFFYQAKAQNDERVYQCRDCGGRWHGKAECGHDNIRSHPTVKPVALMRHLVRLVTPPGGTVLDPFAGTGTTGAACVLEGFHSVLIEREPDHVGDIIFRLQNMTAAPVAESAVTPAGRQGVLF
jgi:site-specific DNA-methyltransferase (adenine-specific)